MRGYLPGAMGLLGILFASSALPAQLTFDFGTGSGEVSGWAVTSNRSNSTAGSIIFNPVLLHLGELQFTEVGGNVFCAQGVTAGACGTSTGLTTAFPVNGGAGTAFTNSVVWSMPAGNGGNYSLASVTLDVTAVPEPVTLGLAGLALVGFGLTYRRKRTK